MVADQRTAPAEARGRAFALYDVLWNSVRLTSLGLGGIIVDQLSIRAICLAGGMLLLIAAPVGLIVPVDDQRPGSFARRSASPSRDVAEYALRLE